jgi:two-component system, OmpR family, response regulator RegX3
MKVLVVEDDEGIAVAVAKGLEREGFDVTRVSSGAEALAAPEHDIVLLDLGLPDRDGLDVCRELRARSAVPIIVVTARGDEVHRVVGLELGADDYVVKPFGLRELAARIRAVVRRTGTTAPANDDDTVHVGALVIDRRAHRVLLDGSMVELTPKEYDLLAFLANDPGRARSRMEILHEVWDAHWYGPTKTLDVHVASLRRKLGDARWIETVRGVGFRLGHPS